MGNRGPDPTTADIHRLFSRELRPYLAIVSQNLAANQKNRCPFSAMPTSFSFAAIKNVAVETIWQMNDRPGRKLRRATKIREELEMFVVNPDST